MAIKINDIPPEGLTVQVESVIDLLNEGAAPSPFSATITIKPEENGIFHVSGKASASPELECSRCLKRFVFPIRDAAMEFDLAPERLVQSPGEHELGPGDMDLEFYRGEEFEPEEIIREQLLLAVPMVPVHSPDCKGLCPVCGIDRNEATCTCREEELEGKESPFAVLKKIIKPEKE